MYIERLNRPGFDPTTLPLQEKIELVRESKGALIHLLEGVSMVDLYLRDCDLLYELPRINCTSMKLVHCPIATIPSFPYKLERLELIECPNLTIFPSGLKMRVCAVERCMSLERLPPDLEAEVLYLFGCDNLKEIPPTIKVKNLFAPNHLSDTVGLDGSRIIRRK